jgi:hypothetical protein
MIDTTTTQTNPKTLPSCRCGTDRAQRAASPERDYTMAGAMYLLWGGTSVPSRVRFRCIHCGDIFDECTERAICREYII